jgi:hypothetical protein
VAGRERAIDVCGVLMRRMDAELHHKAIASLVQYAQAQQQSGSKSPGQRRR